MISNSSKQTEPICNGKIQVEHADKKGYDFGFVENGKLKFYDAQKGVADVCTQETDSVVDAICSEKREGVLQCNCRQSSSVEMSGYEFNQSCA